MNRSITPGLLLWLAALTCGCERIRPPGNVATPLARELMPTKHQIPAEYGRFVTATMSESWPGWGQLYFEEPGTGTIRVVFVSYTDRELEPKVIFIERGGPPAIRESSR